MTGVMILDKEIINWKELLYPYEQTVDELMLKFNYIRKEYIRLGLYSPIESVEGRVKSASSIIEKVMRPSWCRRGWPPGMSAAWRIPGILQPGFPPGRGPARAVLDTRSVRRPP